jgi:hypothetical protein
MQITRRTSIVALALATAALAGAGAAPAAATAQRPRTIHLVEKGGGLKIVDNPPRARHPYEFSPGDMVIVSRTLETPAGVAAGSLQLVCVATSAATQHCAGTESLRGGTLEVVGVSSPASRTTVAVVGGTGVYAGARGTSVSVDRASSRDVADQIVTLLD